MNKQKILAVLVIGLVLLTCVTAVYAKDEECDCGIPKPAASLSLATVTQSATYLFAGGLGPLLFLALAFVIGLIVSHVIWGGF